MVAEGAESGNFDRGAARVSDGGSNAVWAEISLQNSPSALTSSRESSSFSAGVGGTADAYIGKDFITFSGSASATMSSDQGVFASGKAGVDFAQRTDGVTTDVSKDGDKFSGQRTVYPDGSARATVSDFTSVTDIDVGPDGQLRGVETLKNDGRPASRQSGDDLKDKFVPNLGPDGKPDGTSSYTTPEGVRIDKGNCGEVTSISRGGTTVYSRDGSQCLS